MLRYSVGRGMLPSWLSPVKIRWSFLLFYSVCLLLALPHLSLWLDEILQLFGTRDLSFNQLTAYIAKDSGQTPLGYMAQFAILHIFGYSIYSARILSVIFSVLACFGMMKLCARQGVVGATISGVLLAIIPIQFRYALEARPYAIALCISIWTSVLMLRLAEKTSVKRAVWYGVLLTLGFYTQPFTVFVGIAHLLWAVFTKGVKSRLTLLVFIALVFISISYIPWFVHQRNAASASIASLHLGPVVTLRTPLMIIRELFGAGFAGSVLIIAGVMIGVFSSRMTRNEKLFGALLVGVPLIAPIAADWCFGYFVASRQWLFSIPGFIYILGFWIAEIKILKLIYATIIAAVLIYFDLHWLLKPREDWAAATGLILQEIDEKNACVVFNPQSSVRLYEFFDPSITKAQCNVVGHRITKEIIVAVSPYNKEDSAQFARSFLKNEFRLTRELNQQEPKLEIYRSY